MSARSCSRTGAALGAVAVAVASALAAQQPASLAPGQVVRVTAPAVGVVQVVGALASVTADSVVVVSRRMVERDPTRPFSSRTRVDTVRTAVPRAALQTVEVFRGSRSHSASGLRLGLAVGAILGLIQGSGNSCLIYVCKTEGVVVEGAIIGGLVGVVVGANSHTEVWTAVPLSGRAGGLAALPGGRLALGGSLRF